MIRLRFTQEDKMYNNKDHNTGKQTLNSTDYAFAREIRSDIARAFFGRRDDIGGDCSYQKLDERARFEENQGSRLAAADLELYSITDILYANRHDLGAAWSETRSLKLFARCLSNYSISKTALESRNDDDTKYGGILERIDARLSSDMLERGSGFLIEKASKRLLLAEELQRRLTLALPDKR